MSFYPSDLTLSGFEKENLERKVFELKRRMKSQFPRYLRETIFVRLISSLEVFLIDTVREIFLVRKDLFQTQNKIEFSFGEILAAESLADIWTKLINSELRKLQNQGFREITKFYKNRLSVEFNKFSTPLSIIEEFHDRRHLLVHRLGKTDAQYRHQYISTRKTLTVYEDYLLNALDITMEFAGFIDNEAQLVINKQNKKQEKYRDEVKKIIVFEILTEEVSSITDKNFHYSVGDSIKKLGDILISHQFEELKHTVELKGKRADVNEYAKIIKKMQRRKQIIIFEEKNIRINFNFIAKRRNNLSIEIIKLIAKTLPSLPFPQNIHKQIAEKFKISNSKAASAINLILNDENLLLLIGSNETDFTKDS